MVQLKAFKYLETTDEGAALEESPPSPSSASSTSFGDSAETAQEISSGRPSMAQRQQTTSRSSSVFSAASSTAVGGALTSASSQTPSELGERAAGQTDAEDARTLASTEEYQSARVELGDEEGDEHESGESSSDGRKENITEIEIEHAKSAGSSVQKPNMSDQGTFATNEQQAAPRRAPLLPRLKLQMLRSSSSPLVTKQQQVRSPKVMRERMSNGTIGVGSSPLVNAKLSPLTGGDNISQMSVAAQQKAAAASSNQFEIRWHNVRLHARPRSRLPRIITDSYLYKSLVKADADNSSQYDDPGQAACYSPPVQHKIPPTIDENLEMKTGKGGADIDSAANFFIGPATTSASQKVDAQQLAGASGGGGGEQQPALKRRCILNSISGQVFSGQMTAVLGPSGVGKTTLLNSLTGRNTLEGTGRVQLIGATDSKRMSVVTVPQVDVLPGKLTTLEDLEFTSRLKNPQPSFNHSRNIERLVKHLHMDKFLETRIDKLSGGEARRLSIARELLASPDIMILDEPTSGLDANTCKKIITALRDIVEHSDNILDKPMSIIITIHQPQQEVYNLFHRVYVMAQGGRAIYEGSPQLLLPTLIEQSSLTRVCPMDQLNENPAIVAIEVASGEFGPQIISELAAYHETQVYEEFVLYNANVASGPGGGIGSDSPLCTPRSLRPHLSPLSLSRFDMSLHRKRLNSFDSSLGRPTPLLAKRQLAGAATTFDRMSSMTSLSYASTYDLDLPEPTSRLKVDKRLRRSVVMKSNFWSHTGTLIRRCWLLTKRDFFLMAIRIIGFLMVAAGTVQIFSHALNPEEHQCPQFMSEVDDIYSYLGLIRGRLTSLLEMLRQGNSTHLFFFHVLLCITMVTSALTGLVFPLQMRMFLREYKNGWYSPASFIMSQTIAELPADIIGPLITLLITYPLCHQPDSMYHWRQIGYAITLVMTCVICKSQAQIVGAFLMNSVENSVFISCVAVTMPALLSGVPLRITQMITPLQWISYLSFLRYSFESLLSLRYGYGMCPCDPEIVDGYPIRASAQAIPPHLENLARGLLELNQPSVALINVTASDLTNELTILSNEANAQLVSGGHENLFLRFIRLITDASNFFVSGAEIGNCQNYRSLYLIGMDITTNIFTQWLGVMLLMFVVSRFLTYFAVKAVINL